MWYEAVDHNAPLMQGDIVLNCPLVGWGLQAPQVQNQAEGEALRGMVQAKRLDVVVMTQACDLEQNKVDHVILCAHLSLAEFREIWRTTEAAQGQNPTNNAWGKFRKHIMDGFIWNLAMLSSGEADGIHTEHRIVDFREIYTIPKEFLASLLAQRGQRRLRLKPPYREHLSQAFARFFMRVGLPTPIEQNW